MKRLALLLLLVSCVQPAPITSFATVNLPPTGALNPAVTQATISTTICVAGWTRTIRPPASYTTALKRIQMRERHLTGPLSGFEEDHFIPLELGGAPRDPTNLWPEEITAAHRKDLVENRLHASVCNGSMTLANAQRKMITPPLP